jgi:hypothetical protein
MKILYHIQEETTDDISFHYYSQKVIKSFHKEITQKSIGASNYYHFLDVNRGSFRSSREQGIFWSPGTAFENSKNANIFFV